MEIYKDPKSRNWWCWFYDHVGRRQRVSTQVSIERAALKIGQHLQELAECKASGASVSRDTSIWLSGNCPSRLRAKLVKMGLVGPEQAAAGRLLADHIDDYEQSLISHGDTVTHAKQQSERVRKVVDGCGFQSWQNISASRVQLYIHGLDLSTQTKNYYLGAIKGFCRWAVQDRRIADNPLGHLQKMRVTDKQKRHVFEPEVYQKLLQVTGLQPKRFGLLGYERRLLYMIAVETGLRRKELQSLTVGDFDLDERSVTVESRYAKNRKEAVLPLRKGTAGELCQYFEGKDRAEKAFPMSKHIKTAKMIRQDLAAAGIEFGQVGGLVDFHGLRAAFGTMIHQAGASVKETQELMRHSDPRLTMGVYVHSYRGALDNAVEKLPDFSGQDKAGAARKTGTDDRIGVDMVSKVGLKNSDTYSDKSASKGGISADVGGQLGGKTANARIAVKGCLEGKKGVSEPLKANAPDRTRTCDLRIRNPLLYPAELRA